MLPVHHLQIQLHARLLVWFRDIWREGKTFFPVCCTISLVTVVTKPGRPPSQAQATNWWRNPKSATKCHFYTYCHPDRAIHASCFMCIMFLCVPRDQFEEATVQPHPLARILLGHALTSVCNVVKGLAGEYASARCSAVQAAGLGTVSLSPVGSLIGSTHSTFETTVRRNRIEYSMVGESFVG